MHIVFLISSFYALLVLSSMLYLSAACFRFVLLPTQLKSTNRQSIGYYVSVCWLSHDAGAKYNIKYLTRMHSLCVYVKPNRISAVFYD